MKFETTSLVCPSCGAQAHMDAFGERALCEYCGNEQLFSSAERPELRPAVAQPAEVLIENNSQSARLIHRWFSYKFVPLAFFAIAWDAFLIYWYGLALIQGAPWIMTVFPIAHVAVGIGLTYYTLAGFVNRTILELDRENISIRFKPLPWFGKITMRSTELKQLYCKEQIIHSKNGSRTQFVLYAVTTANKQAKLLGGLDNADAAIFLEQQLERWLRIEDRPVAGEIPR